MVAGARDLRGVAGRKQHSAVGVVDMKIERRPRQSFIYQQSHQIQCNQTEGRSMTEDQDQQTELAEQLCKLDRQIKELRRIRSAASYDLEHAVKERDRILRHLREGERSA